MDSFQRVLPFSPALLFPLLLGQRDLLPPCPRHTGYCGLRGTLQLLGQRRPHKVKDLRAAGPANHSLQLQSQRQHLCVRVQLWLVKGGRLWACLLCASGLSAYFLLILSVWLWLPQGHEYYNPQKKNYIFLRNAAEELKPRNKKWWEKGNCHLQTWMLHSQDGAPLLPLCTSDSQWNPSRHPLILTRMDVDSENRCVDPLSAAHYCLSVWLCTAPMVIMMADVIFAWVLF